MTKSKLFITAISLALLGTMVVGCGGPKIVTFPDENLELAIGAALNKPAGEDITLEELVGLTTLNASESDITNLSGLEYCTNLTELILWENQISDISSLSSLTNLTNLNLCQNQISDISPISQLTNLTSLWIWENQISDISPLYQLTNLTVLSLSLNQISDISPLYQLTNLTELNLWENKVSDVSPLVENIGLDTGDIVWLQENNLDLWEGSEDINHIRTLEDRGVTVRHDPLQSVP